MNEYDHCWNDTDSDKTMQLEKKIVSVPLFLP